MSFDRKNAFSLDIVDPDDNQTVAPVTGMLNLNDKSLLIFKTTGVYEALTADQIDPGNTQPETRHSYKKIYSVGSNHPCLARMTMQFKDIFEQLKFLRIEGLDLDGLKEYTWEANKYLLECTTTYNSLHKKSLDLVKTCDDIIKNSKGKGHIPALPVIKDLEKDCVFFFGSAKKFLVLTYGLLEIFYKQPKFKENFQGSYEWVKKNLGEKHPVYKILTQDKEWVKLLAQVRNAIEHPKDGQFVDFKGFQLIAGNKFSNPSWNYNLELKGLGKENDLPLIENLDAFLHNLLTLYEELLFLCIEDLPNFEQSFVISEKPDSKINNNSVIKYTLNFKIGLY